MIYVDGSVTFGQWLRTWRIARGLSIKGAAQTAGWKPQFWSNLEQEARLRKSGLPPKPDEQTVEVIARILNVPLDIAMLAAGHAPFDLQTQMCSFVPEKQGDAYKIPEQFPNFRWVCAECNDKNQEAPGDYSLVEDANLKLQMLHYGDARFGEVVQRLSRVEDYIEKIVHSLAGISEAKPFPKSISHNEK